jgi:hypothetical protein
MGGPLNFFKPERGALKKYRETKEGGLWKYLPVWKNISSFLVANFPIQGRLSFARLTRAFFCHEWRKISNMFDIWFTCHEWRKCRKCCPHTRKFCRSNLSRIPSTRDKCARVRRALDYILVSRIILKTGVMCSFIRFFTQSAFYTKSAISVCNLYLFCILYLVCSLQIILTESTMKNATCISHYIILHVDVLH